jgi:hypothetical protein
MPNIPVQAAAEGVSSVKNLFTAWKKQHHLINSTHLPEPVLDAASEHLGEIANQILALRSKTTADFAMKLIAGTDNGAAPVPGELIDEAHDLLGPEAPNPQYASKLLQAEDLVYECAHLCELVFMAIEGMELDAETKALSAGVYVIRQKMLDAGNLMDLAKRPAGSKDSLGKH